MLLPFRAHQPGFNFFYMVPCGWSLAYNGVAQPFLQIQENVSTAQGSSIQNEIFHGKHVIRRL